MHDTPQRYGSVARWLHWGMAVLILWQFLKLGDRISDGEHWIGQTLVPWHVSIGAVLLVLAVVRVLWVLRQRPQRPRHVGATAPLARVGHFLLYLVMVLLPITGILTMAGNGYGLQIFGMQIIAQRESEIGWMATLGGLHSPLALLFVVLSIGHVAAALYHHFVLHDDTMKRILG